ncbi:multidrug resistance protein homolog 49-like isoform X2 [Maniola hyperantus]|uniref:multidrug resistance protein homolog 49-like isoform X2 n=1 Tax=Aphantopus hyperantus TaxID=2795564 RepID=UPI00156A29EE|nr:multidrug resistance protein homolog 49-like [Maniola hyperantus]
MGHKKKKSESKREATPEPENVSYFQIFRYAKWVELLATIVGILAGLLSGGGVCYNLVQFGELSTAFVERTAQQEQCSSHLPLTSIFGGGRRLCNASHEENMEALVEDGTAMAIGMIISVVISLVLCMLSVALVSWSALRQITRIRIVFLEAVLRQDMSWFDTDSEFNLATKMTDNMVKLKEGMGEKLSVVANLVGTSIICLCQAFPMGWELTLACVTVVPFSITASVILSKYQTKSSIRELESYSQAGKQAEEVLKSIRTIVAFGGESKEVDRYRRLLEPAERYGKKRGLYTGLGTGFNWVLTYSLNAIGLTYGTRLVLADWDKPTDERKYLVGILFSILFSVYMATQSITLCVPHAEIFASARGAAASIFKMLDRKPTIDSLKRTGVSPRRVLGDIALEDVHFSYPSRPNVKVLQGFSIHIKAGECVALVGSSGCGKSTILQLLQRLYDPLHGTVKLDGRSLKNLNLGWLRSSLGVVGQEPVLFRGTIHENIAIGSPEATREDVQRVADMAYAHDFITHLPNGYDTMIGERGTSLSGGQKQRIAIARSLLREPAVLLLDEATSALDPHSERQVQAALDRASVGRTTLMVSHRLSTIVNADRIICMDQGTIVEQGTHEELMKTKGFYYKLVTTGHENKEPDVIETLPEEENDNAEGGELTVISRVEVKRRSTRRLVRHHSVKRESHDWMTPRGSITSVMSAGLQNFVYNADYDSEEEKDDEDVKPVSDWQLLKLNAPEWPFIVVGSIAAFIQGSCFPVFALLFGYTAGIFVLESRGDIIYQADFYSGMFLVVAAVAGLSMFLQSTTFTNAGLKMTTRLRQQYFSALLKQEIGFFDKDTNTVGALCARLSGDAAEVQGATGLRIGLILQGTSSVVVGFIMAVCYNWKLTLVGTAFLPLMVGSIWLEGIVSQKSQSDERSAMESATSIATEAVVSIKTVQSLGVEEVFLTKFKEALVVSCAAVAKKTRWRGLVLGLGVYVPFLSYCSATVYGAVLVAYEGVEYKVVMLVNEAIMYGAYMLGQSLVYAPSFNSAKACGAKILAIINREPKVKTETGVRDRKDWTATGNFGIKDVEFSYPTRPNQRVLKGIDLKVDAGKTVALVGSSGCGKSTILQLMQRFYDPDTGSIELDNRDTRSALTLPRLRRQLGVVQQEPVLFDRTIADNIAYGDNNRKVTTQEIIAAAKAANIHTFIVSLPKGYETNLGANGAQLSGGQKQRVCIARALIRSPRLLLLDEATSALDANSERAVSEALDKAAKGRTCVTIAHRLSTIKDADIICVLDKGKIVEQGTHTELISAKGYYWRMSKGQNMA